jgi:hypothetical protein
MRKQIFLALWVMSIAVSAQTSSGEEKTILNFSKKKFDWMITRQLDSLSFMLDDRIQYIHSNGWIQSKKEIIDDLKSDKVNYTQVTIKEATVRMYNTTAIVSGLGSFEGITDGKSFTLELRYTEVYIKTGKHWKLVLRHANRMP